MDATTVAVDLAKDIFEVALDNRASRVIERKRLTRRQFERFIDGLNSITTGRIYDCIRSRSVRRSFTPLLTSGRSPYTLVRRPVRVLALC